MRTIQILYAVIFEIDDPMHLRKWSVGSTDLVIPAAHVKKEALFENHLLALNLTFQISARTFMLGIGEHFVR